MMVMEDLMRSILEHKRVAESRKRGQSAPGSGKAQLKAATEQLHEAMSGREPKPKKQRKGLSAPLAERGDVLDELFQDEEEAGEDVPAPRTSSNKTATDAMAAAASDMARAVASCAKAGSDKPAPLMPGSVEAALAERRMRLEEARHSDRHALSMAKNEQHFQLQLKQLELMKAEMEERAARLAIELETLRQGGRQGRQGMGGVGCDD